MALKDLDQLVAEIDAAVHPNGPLGKTTAPGLNALLKSLAAELTARPGGGAGAPLDVATTLAGAGPGAVPTVAATLAGLQDEQYQQPLTFEVSGGGAPFVATLSLAQLRQVVQAGTLPGVLAASPDTGAAVSFTATYDAARATVALAAPDPTTGQPYRVRQIGGGGAAGALEFVFEASFADAVGRTLGPRQAGTYASEQRQNVASVTYQVNGVARPALQSQPLALASGDVLQVAITRTDAAQPAVLTLLG